MILLKSCATILRGNPRYPLVFDSSALEAVHPVPEYIPYLAQDLACLVQANFLVDVTHIRRHDRRTFLVKKRWEDSLAKFNGIMGMMDQALLTEGVIKEENVPLRKRLPQTRRTLDPFAGRERSISKFQRPNHSTQHSYNEEESEESTVQLDEEDPGDLSVSTIQSRRRESLTELFTIKRVSQSGNSPSESRSKTRLINTSYWEARICFIKEEWFWWTDSALDEENALGRVCFRDEDTDFGMDSKNPFIYIRDKDVTYTFKSTPHSMSDWHEALRKAKEIGIQKRKTNEPIQKDPPAFSQLKSTYLFNEKPPYNTKFYAFNSGYLRDVVYNLMLFKQRELVHGSCINFFKEKYDDPKTQNTKNIKVQLDSHQRHIQMYRKSSSVAKRGRQSHVKSGILNGGIPGIIIDQGKKLLDNIKTRRTDSIASPRRRMTHLLDHKKKPAEAIRMRQTILSPIARPSTPANEERRTSLLTKFYYIQELIRRRELVSEGNYNGNHLQAPKSFIISTNELSLPNSPSKYPLTPDGKRKIKSST